MTYDKWYNKYVSSNPDAVLSEKKLKHLKADKEQFKKYKKVLGKEFMPVESFGDFQNLKYTDADRWKVVKADYRKLNAYDKIISNEPLITKDLKEVSKETGVKMVGLEYRLKSKDSYLRKVKTDSKNSLNYLDIDKTIKGTNDVIRYTYQNGPDKLVESYNKVVDRLTDKDYSIVKVKNTWTNKFNPYKGVNCIFASSNGQKFEVQFHTPESFELKNGQLHKLYEEFRLIEDKTSPRAKELQNKMIELSFNLEKPKNIDTLRWLK